MKLTDTIEMNAIRLIRKRIPKVARYSINTNSTNQNFHDHGEKSV